MKKRKEDDRQMQGPWKWQLIDLLTRIVAKLDDLGKNNETKRKLSDAGKKSAAARKAKFGSNRPPGSNFKPEPSPELLASEPPCVAPTLPRQQNLEGIIEPDREPVPEPVHKTRKKTTKPPAQSSQVWETYAAAYLERYKVTPLRNARVNQHCKSLVDQLGIALAVEISGYYVGRNDAFLVNAKHPLGLCILNLQKFVTERENGTVVTMTDARRVEAHSQTDRAIQQYANSQGGDREPLREQVHVKEVKSAAT